MKAKGLTQGTLSSIEENRQFTGYYKKLAIPAIPQGAEKYLFAVGDTVLSLNRGCKGVIKSRYIQHGYCYYDLGNLGIHRQKDIQ